jgi:hypothetical protein
MLVTVYITAGQAPDQFHFSKYFLLGSIYLWSREITTGGCAGEQVRRGRAGHKVDTAGGIV